MVRSGEVTRHGLGVIAHGDQAQSTPAGVARRAHHRVAVYHCPVDPALSELVSPVQCHSWASLENDANQPPRRPGVYAWYFARDAVPANVPLVGAHAIDDEWILLYIGIAPAKPSPLKPPSRKTLRSRLRFHFRGNARGSTLRLTLGCLLGLPLVRVGSNDRLTFCDGEAVLSRWMAEHARVCWVENERPWELEDLAIASLHLPFNLAGNRRSPFFMHLSALRSAAKVRALG